MLKKIEWKKGSSSISLAVSILGFCIFFILIIHIFTTYVGNDRVQTALQVIARDIVVCESKDKAEEMAKEEATQLLEGQFLRDIDAYVTLNQTNIGKTTKWKKGQFATLHITGKINGLFSNNAKNFDYEYTFMIENKGKTTGSSS